MPLPSGKPSFLAGFRLFPGEQLQGFVDWFTSTAAAITAFAGGGQASAVPLTSAMNEVSIVATANDSVALPLAVPGMHILLRNADAADAVQVFGSPLGTDTINGTAGATGISVASGKSVLFWCPVAGKWYSLLSA